MSVAKRQLLDTTPILYHAWYRLTRQLAATSADTLAPHCTAPICTVPDDDPGFFFLFFSLHSWRIDKDKTEFVNAVCVVLCCGAGK